jgi:hypothetical protein
MSSKSYYRIKEEGALLNPMRMARVYAGVDVSKDRLDVCLRWSEPESHEEDLFFVTHDDAGIDTLVSRFLEERLVLVILERPPAASSERWLGLWPPRACR